MKKYLSFFVVLVMVFVVGIVTAKAEDTGLSSSGKVCTMEAKLCPDGSYVGRTGPNCEFASCPGQKDKETKRDDVKKSIEAMRQESKQKMEALRANIKVERDSAKARIKELRLSVRENALQRFDAAVARINGLKDEVNKQITRLAAKGVDVTNAKSLVVTSEVKLNDAKGKVAEINTILSVSINELSADNKTRLKTLVNDTQNLVKDAHQALKDAIKSLKDGVKVRVEAENN